MVEHVPPETLNPEHLRALYRVSGWINSTLDFDQALDNAMDAIMQVTNAQRGFLMILNNDTNELEVLVARGINGEEIENEGYSTTIVNEVVKTGEPLLTNNAQFDTRFSAGQSIIMRGLRAILSAPMMVQDRLIGVVYVDTSMKAGTFRPEDASLIQAVSGLAARAIENARLYAVAKEKGRLEQELQMAHEIQRNLLPAQLPRLPGYEIAPHWEAAREVAGDFYDAFELDGDTMGTVIADVSDKGAPAALFMAVARTLIRSHASAGMTSIDAVSRANDLLMIDAEYSGMFVTLYFSRFFADGRSEHVNGGHNPPAYYSGKSGTVEYLPIGGRALGWFPNNPLEEVTIQLESGDVIVYYTDGLTEAENPQGEPYGEDRLAQVLQSVGQTSALEIRDAILRDVEIFCAGQLPFDDLTMMVVRYTG
jgi:sigma-B regulation protein RsbU (phosphoserine phosphatase)